MQKLITIFLVGCTTILKAQNLSLLVNIKNFKSNEGMAYVLLQDHLRKNLQQQWIKVEKNEAKVIFKNLQTGKYAVRLYHDANNNKKLDTDFWGLPKENWGCSNNVKPRFAAPKFEDMIFKIEKDETITINLN